jgi:hypothetical protein
MVQTASTSEADQSQAPGAAAVRMLGALLILQGGYRVYTQVNAVVFVVQREIYSSYLLATLLLSALIGLLAIMAGVLLVRLDRAGRGFGLVVCSIALAHQVITFASTLVAFKVHFSAAWPSLGLLFWLLSPAYMILFLVGIILIARWYPPRLPG